MDEDTSPAHERIVYELLGSTVPGPNACCQAICIKPTAHSRWKETDEVLLVIVLNVEDHVLEMLWEARADGEALLRVADAHSGGQ